MPESINREVLKYLNYLKDSYGDSVYFDENVILSSNQKYKGIMDSRSDTIIEETEVVERNLLDPTKEVQKEEVIKKSVKNKESVNKDWMKSESLDVLNTNISSCLECGLGETRNQFVFGSGNPNADIMFVGEAPGADEDAQGLPFVGRAGKLLTKIIESIDLTRDDVYIANIIKCRPPNNRRPLADEVDKCEPYLKRQIELINPKFIMSLGLTSIDTLLKSKHKMKDSRGKVFDYHGKKLFVTYHPAALLRNPNWKKDTWEDMKMLRRMFDEANGIKSRFSE